MSKIFIRPVTKNDLEAVHTMNEHAVPHVNSITLGEFETFMQIASFFLVSEDSTQLTGFLIVLSPGETYDSENYRYFSKKYDSFDYVDRIVIGEPFRGKGIGSAFYSYLKAHSKQAVITCEVNLKPPNPQSIQFHEKIGFTTVGQQHSEEGKKWVNLMVWR